MMTSSTSKPTGEEHRLPVILEPPLLVQKISYQSAPLSSSHSAEEPEAEENPDIWKTATGNGILETGSASVVPTPETRLADEGPVAAEDEEEWTWKYDEHGKKIWHRKTGIGTGGVQDVPEGQVGIVRFATRPPQWTAAIGNHRKRSYSNPTFILIVFFNILSSVDFIYFNGF